MTDHTNSTEYIDAVDLPPLFEPAPRQLSTVIMNESEAYRYMSREDARLSKIPEEYRSENVCTLAVQKEGSALKDVPEEHRSYWLCTEAVSTNGLALVHVPQEHRDYVLCSIAVESHGAALAYVPDELHTPELVALSARYAHWDIAQSVRPVATGLRVIEGGKTESIGEKLNEPVRSIRVLTKQTPVATQSNEVEAFELPADLQAEASSGQTDYETALSKAQVISLRQKDNDRDR